MTGATTKGATDESTCTPGCVASARIKAAGTGQLTPSTRGDAGAPILMVVMGTVLEP